MVFQRIIYVLAGASLIVAPRMARAQEGGLSQANVPVLGTGQMPTAVPSNEFSPTNLFVMTVTAGVRFDDNALLGSVPHRSDLAYSFMPSFAFDQTLRRVNWGVSYGPGVDISEHAFYSDQFTNDFGGHFTWLISKRSSFSAQQNYILSTDPFQQFGTQAYTTTPGPIVSPNESIFLPNLRRESSLSQAQYSYRLAAHTTFGISGNFDLEHFRENSGSPNSSVLINSRIASGQAYISHQFSARNQLGLEYAVQVMKFPIGDARTTTHSFLIFDDFKLTPNSKLSVYAGPEYSLTSNQVELGSGFLVLIIPVKANEWTWSGGGIYSWTRPRFAMVLNYSRRISNGGGLTGAVELDGGSADFSWELTSRWSLRLDLAGANNQLLGVTAGQSGLLTYSASVGLRREILRNTYMNLFFQRLNQTGGILGFSTGNHDMAGVSFECRFAKPLGR